MVAYCVFVALLTLTSVVAHTCYFSQEPNQLVDSGRYHWVLSDNPCLCAKFRLGGVNTVPSQRPGDPIRVIDASLLRKRPDEIRDSMGCITESSLYNTNATRMEIVYPFDPFKSALLVYIDVTVLDLRVYLTTKGLSPPPYKIEFQGDKLSVAKLKVREPGVYTNVVSEVIPSSGSADGRHFWLYYRYDASAAVIQVGLDQNTPEYVDHSPPQETTYLGTFSNDAAEWKIRHYLKT